MLVVLKFNAPAFSIFVYLFLLFLFNIYSYIFCRKYVVKFLFTYTVLRDCFFFLFFADCGRANQTSQCPQCHKAVGGENHESQPGHVKIDFAPTMREKIASTPGLVEISHDTPTTHSVR